jgi:hypothetical protein
MRFGFMAVGRVAGVVFVVAAAIGIGKTAETATGSNASQNRLAMSGQRINLGP